MKWIIIACVIAVPAIARAQAGAGSGSGSGSDDAEIEKALAADAAAQKAAAPAAAVDQTVGPAPAQSMNPDLSFIADFAAGSFSKQALEAGDHDPHEDGFQLQALELAASKSVDPYFKFDANLAFSNDGVEIEEAYATTLDLPWNLQARVGKFLTQFGRINPTHAHTWDFADAPFAMTRAFGGEGNRGVGVELSYLTPLPWYVELIGSATDPRSGSFLPADATIDHAWTAQATLAAKQFFELGPDWSLLWGLSYAEGPHGGDALHTHVAGTDLYLKYRPITFGSDTIVSLQTEWIYRKRAELGGALTDVGGYAQLFWRFAKRWGAGARYEYGTADANDPDWMSDRHRGAVALTFWPTEFSRLRAQLQADDPRWLTPSYEAFVTLELSVGVHGAHKF